MEKKTDENLVRSLLDLRQDLRAGYGIWLDQFLIIAYVFYSDEVIQVYPLLKMGRNILISPCCQYGETTEFLATHRAHRETIKMFQKIMNYQKSKGCSDLRC